MIKNSLIKKGLSIHASTRFNQNLYIVLMPNVEVGNIMFSKNLKLFSKPLHCKYTFKKFKKQILGKKNQKNYLSGM